MDALGNSPQGPRQTVRKSCGGEVRRLSPQAVALVERWPKLITELPTDALSLVFVGARIAYHGLAPL